MDAKRVLTCRYDFLLAKKAIDDDPEWANEYAFLNWNAYCISKAEYVATRKIFLERRRHERTAAARAAAEAEVARLRAALEAVAAQWPGLGCTIPEEWMSKERHYRLGFDDGRARVAVIARAALDICGEAAHENR